LFSDIDECSADVSVCDVNAVCQNTFGSYICSCKAGFTGDGKNCTDIDECESNPCHNSGTCTDRVNGFICSCRVGFHGSRCETSISINSALISDNEVYVGHLGQFLAPVVGEPSQWVLCYRASTHGWAVSTFHSRCDGKNNTVTIIKNGQYVFGGYTDIPWGNLFVV